jgi:hypothetical protein
VVGISTLLAGVGWIAANDLLALNKPEASTVITIEKDDTLDEIPARLKEEKIIEYPMLFKRFSHYSDAMEKIVRAPMSSIPIMITAPSSQHELQFGFPAHHVRDDPGRLYAGADLQPHAQNGVCEYDALMEMAATPIITSPSCRTSRWGRAQAGRLISSRNL